MKIRWTPAAKHSYMNILSYLEESWSEREILKFIDDVDKLIRLISTNPEMFQESKIKKNIRKGYISKYNTLYYRYRPGRQELELLNFWDNRQDPQKLFF